MIFLLVTAIAVFCDQVIKLFVQHRIPLYIEAADRVSVIPGFVSIIHVQNTGMAFSLLDSLPSRYILGAVSVVGAIVIVLFLYRLRNNRLASFGLSLMLGGTIGNGIDRLRLGYVTDMIQLDFFPSFPAFNFADMLLISGVIIVVIYILISGRSAAKNTPLPEDIEYYDEDDSSFNEEPRDRAPQERRRRKGDTSPVPADRVLTQEEQFELSLEQKREATAPIPEIYEEEKPRRRKLSRAEQEQNARTAKLMEEHPAEMGSFSISREPAAELDAEPVLAEAYSDDEADVKPYTKEPRHTRERTEPRQKKPRGEDLPRENRRAAQYDTPYEVDNYRSEGAAVPEAVRSRPARPQQTAPRSARPQAEAQPRPERPARPAPRPEQQEAPRRANEERRQAPAAAREDYAAPPRREPGAVREDYAPRTAAPARPAAARPAAQPAASARPSERPAPQRTAPRTEAPPRRRVDTIGDPNRIPSGRPAAPAARTEPSIDDILAEFEANGDLPDTVDFSRLDEYLD